MRAQASLRGAGYEGELPAAAFDTLRPPLAEVTSAEYPTPDEYLEAGATVASTVAARLAG